MSSKEWPEQEAEMSGDELKTDQEAEELRKVATFFESAVEQSRKNQRRFFLSTGVWLVLALLAVSLFAYWVREINETQDKFKETQKTVKGLEHELMQLQSNTRNELSRAKEKTNEATVLLAGVREDVAQMEEATRVAEEATQAQISKLQQSLVRIQSALEDAERTREKSVRISEELDDRLATVGKDLERYREEFRVFNEDARSALEEIDRTTMAMRDRIATIELELDSAHYQFRGNRWNEVLGMDIFVKLGKIQKQAPQGVKDFCVAATDRGDCIVEKDFLGLNELVVFTHTVVDQSGGEVKYQYRLIARYRVPFPFSPIPDQIGLAVYRKPAKPPS